MKKIIFGTGLDKMPNFAFQFMKFFFKVYYFFKPVKAYLDEFGIQPGFTVVDYGCGPGHHLVRASELAGTTGLVYAVDIHELAITSVEKVIGKYSLKNVRPVLVQHSMVPIASQAADLIYAIDMFHMVKDSDQFLQELHRISKSSAILIIEDGHQPRQMAKQKIVNSGCWDIVEEKKKYLKCRPLQNNS